MKTKLNLILILAFAIKCSALADSATWNLDPISGDWNTAANWTPNTVPNGSGDIATFDVSNLTSISIAPGLAGNLVDSIVFDSNASAYTITTVGGTTGSSVLTISGAGILNSSSFFQQFVNAPTESGITGHMLLTGSATVGSSVMITNQGGGSLTGGGGETSIAFTDETSAGDATIINEGALATAPQQPGTTLFYGGSTAGRATITCLSGAVTGAYAGNANFYQHATAGNGTFVLQGGAAAEGFAGQITFSGHATAGDGNFAINGTEVAGSTGGFLVFRENSTAGNATLIATGGSAAGGRIHFERSSSGGTARIQVYGHGTLDAFGHLGALEIGSLEGDGFVLGFDSLGIGSNALSTTFSGTIRGGGRITKIGNGTLTLSRQSTYTGGTTVGKGVLLVTNLSGSATGSGPITVNTGTLGGSGFVTGAVIVGTGSGAGAFLAPGAGVNLPTTFTTSSLVTFNADSTYTCTLEASARQALNDMIVANGVTIGGARFFFRANISGRIPVGTVFTVISNTSAAPIGGTFSNLPDGSTIAVDSNTFQASYESGDGNDLTLTVVP